MFCTDDERNTCQVEKMGCKGCFYNIDKNQMCKKRKIKVSEIKIYEKFRKKQPNDWKMKARWEYYRKTGELHSAIVINQYGYLIDGYTSYLIALTDGIKNVDVEVEKC